VALVLAAGVLGGCGSSDNSQQSAQPTTQDLKGTVSASGSTALLPLLKTAQEEFQKKYPNVTVNVAGGGSFVGQNQVASGAVAIGDSDVALQSDLEGKGLVEHLVVGIPFVFIANTDVAVDNLTQQQYIDIFTGKITNWSKVGGKDENITIIHRAKSSGSRKTIANVVLKGAAFTDNAVIQDSNGAVRSAIAGTPGAIGYVDAAYVDQTIKALAYNGVSYSIDNVANKTYPVYTVGRMFTKGQAAPEVQAFIDFVTSKDFQDTYAVKKGFVPVYKMQQ